jgi:hypothetical protein
MAICSVRLSAVPHIFFDVRLTAAALRWTGPDQTCRYQMTTRSTGAK